MIDLRDDIKSISYPDPQIQAILRDIYERIETLEKKQDEIIEKLNEHAENINTVWNVSKRISAPKGQKTLQRLEKLNQVLKDRPSRGLTLTELERELDVSSQQMSLLISKLDKRIYEISYRKEKGVRHEKIIKLRTKW